MHELERHLGEAHRQAARLVRHQVGRWRGGALGWVNSSLSAYPSPSHVLLNQLHPAQAELGEAVREFGAAMAALGRYEESVREREGRGLGPGLRSELGSSSGLRPVLCSPGLW